MGNESAAKTCPDRQHKLEKRRPNTGKSMESNSWAWVFVQAALYPINEPPLQARILSTNARWAT